MWWALAQLLAHCRRAGEAPKGWFHPIIAAERPRKHLVLLPCSATLQRERFGVTRESCAVPVTLCKPPKSPRGGLQAGSARRAWSGTGSIAQLLRCALVQTQGSEGCRGALWFGTLRLQGLRFLGTAWAGRREMPVVLGATQLGWQRTPSCSSAWGTQPSPSTSTEKSSATTPSRATSHPHRGSRGMWRAARKRRGMPYLSSARGGAGPSLRFLLRRSPSDPSERQQHGLKCLVPPRSGTVCPPPPLPDGDVCFWEVSAMLVGDS